MNTASPRNKEWAKGYVSKNRDCSYLAQENMSNAKHEAMPSCQGVGFLLR
jgi:hypothetical protein